MEEKSFDVDRFNLGPPVLSPIGVIKILKKNPTYEQLFPNCNVEKDYKLLYLMAHSQYIESCSCYLSVAETQRFN